MHRTQLIIEDKQFELLKQWSKQDGLSMSMIVRNLIDMHSQDTNIFSLKAIAGIARDDKAHGVEHDQWINGR